MGGGSSSLRGVAAAASTTVVWNGKSYIRGVDGMWRPSPPVGGGGGGWRQAQQAARRRNKSHKSGQSRDRDSSEGSVVDGVMYPISTISEEQSAASSEEESSANSGAVNNSRRSWLYANTVTTSSVAARAEI